MSDNDYLYVKKKHFYSIILVVLIFIMYAIDGTTVGDNRMNTYAKYGFQILAMGYFFYIAFLLAKLKWQVINKEADEGKKDYKF